MRARWPYLSSNREKADLKKTRWPLQKRPWNLSDLENAKLADLEEKNLPIYRAYLLKESLATILDGRQINVASRKLDGWIEWAVVTIEFRTLLSQLSRSMRGSKEGDVSVAPVVRLAGGNAGQTPGGGIEEAA